MTQPEKILKLHNDSITGWVCQNVYRANYIFSPHKRREELEKHLVKCALRDYNYIFTRRECVHGFRNVFDYKLEITPKIKPMEINVPKAPHPQATLPLNI